MTKVLVCVDLNNESVNLFKEKLKSWNWDQVEEVHFVHGFQLQVYADTFYWGKYPVEEEYKAIEDSVSDVLTKIEEEIFKGDKKPTIKNKCIFALTPKKEFVEYVKENKIDQMIIGTRGKHGVEGLFSSSFAEYMVRHANCELRIIRGE